MARRNKEAEREYQRRYYENVTKLKRKENPAKSYYKKKTPEEIAENRHNGSKKAAETLRQKLGEEGYKQYMSERGKSGIKKLQENGGLIGFQRGYAKEAAALGAKARGLKSKHKKVREKYQDV